MIFEEDLLFSLIKVTFITLCTLGMMSSLTLFKYSVKKVFLIFGVYLLWVAVSSAVLLHWFGFDGILRIFLLTISAPAIILAYIMDKHSPAQSVFNYATQIDFSLVLIMLAVMLNTAVNGNKVTDLLIRGVIYSIVIFLEWRFLRRPFRRLADVIQKGWGVLSLIPVAFCLLLVLLATVPGHYFYNPVNILYILGVILSMLVVYFAVFQSLMRQYRLQMLTHDRDVLQIQIAAMNKQAEAVLSSEDRLHILRHDIRHFTTVMRANLQAGSIEQAVSALSAFESSITENSRKTYCGDYIINSILVTYFEKAERIGTEVKVNFTEPPADHIDSTAFAVMLANALENALHACEAGSGQQSISLKSRLFNGQYLMELANTCDYAVTFDGDRWPLSRKGPGHGIGTRSILAFAKEHNASVCFRMRDGVFVLQMMLETIHSPAEERLPGRPPNRRK